MTEFRVMIYSKLRGFNSGTDVCDMSTWCVYHHGISSDDDRWVWHMSVTYEREAIPHAPIYINMHTHTHQYAHTHINMFTQKGFLFHLYYDTYERDAIPHAPIYLNWNHVFSVMSTYIWWWLLRKCNTLQHTATHCNIEKVPHFQGVHWGGLADIWGGYD